MLNITMLDCEPGFETYFVECRAAGDLAELMTEDADLLRGIISLYLNDEKGMDLSVLRSCHSLEGLHIRNCEGVFDFKDAKTCPRLQVVRMFDCKGDVRLDGLCDRMETLEAKNCPGLDLSLLASNPRMAVTVTRKPKRH